LTRKAKRAKMKRSPGTTPPGTGEVIKIEDELRNHLANVQTPPHNTIQCTTLHAALPTHDPSLDVDRAPFSVPPLKHYLPDLKKSALSQEFSLEAICLLSTENMGSGNNDNSPGWLDHQAQGKGLGSRCIPNSLSTGDPIPTTACLFIYEIGSDLQAKSLETTNERPNPKSLSPNNKAILPSRIYGGRSSFVKWRGPASFKQFPDHHFFVTLFRNAAVSSLWMGCSPWSELTGQ